MDLWEEEIKLLKEELRSLKECQTQYVSIGVGASGLIFAYAVGTGSLFRQFSAFNVTSVPGAAPAAMPCIDPIFLAPIFIILPIWCIVFDKSTSITRIAGYYQILEKINLDKGMTTHFIGWENSLQKLRDMGRVKEKQIKNGRATFWADLKFKQKCEYFLKILFGKSTYQQYWRLIFYSFFGLCLLCFTFTLAPLLAPYGGHTLPEVLHFNKWLLILSVILFMITSYITYYNTKIFYQLSQGFHSYSANKILWEKLLIEEIDVTKIEEYKEDTSLWKYRKYLYLLIAFVLLVILFIFL